MKIVFMGTPDFAVETLKELVENNYEVCLVVSQMDKPKGRGMVMQMTPVKEYATKNNIEVIQPIKARGNAQFVEKLKSVNADLFVVVAYGQILPQEILDIPKLGCINVHGSLLPLYRGSAPIQRSIMNCDKKTGITTMYMDAGMDTGDMILKEEILIEDEDNYETMYNKLKVMGAKLLIKTLKCIEKGDVIRTMQGAGHTVAPMICKADCKIDFSKTTREVYNLVRGVYPCPCAHTCLDDGRVFKVHEAKLLSENENIDKDCYGEVVESNPREGLIVNCKDGQLQLLVIQEQNSKKMNSTEYLRGKKIDIGQKFV